MAYLLPEKGWKSKWDSKWLIFVCVFVIAGVTLQREQDSPLPVPLVILPYMKHGDLRRFLIDTRYGDIPMVRGRHASATWRPFEMSACTLHRRSTTLTMYYWTHHVDNKVNKMSVDSETSIFHQVKTWWQMQNNKRTIHFDILGKSAATMLKFMCNTKMPFWIVE